MFRLSFLVYFLVFSISASALADGNGKTIILKNYDDNNLLLSRGHYDDLRIFESETIWIVRYRNLVVNLSYKDNLINSIQIKRLQNGKVIELFYQRNKKNLLSLQQAFMRTEMVFNYTVFSKFDSNKECSSSIENSATQLITKLSDKLDDDSLFNNLEGSIIDSSCKGNAKIIDEKNYINLESGIANSVKYISPNETELTSCLKTSDQIRPIFATTPEEKIQLDVLIAKLKLESAKVYANSPQMKSLISCEKSTNPSPLSNCSESGAIKFFQNTPIKNLDSSKEAERVFSHELLHRVGVTDEKTADAIISICVDNKKLSPSDFPKKPQIAWMMIPSIKPGKDALAAATTDTPAVITQDVAAAVPKTVDPVATGIPTAQQLAATTAISTATDNGAATVVQQSTAQSSGILGFANQVTASFVTPATAATTTTLASTAVTVPNVMTTAGGAVGTAAATRNPASVSEFTPSTVGANEKVVEEIDLDKQSKATATAAGNIDVNKVAAASVGGKTYSSGAVTKQATNNEIATTNAGGNNSGGNGGAQIIGGGGGGNSGGNGGANLSATPIVKAAQRAPAASGGSTALMTTPSREELTTYFLNSDYTAARQKLQDPKMQQNLKSTGISVIDLNGNSIGAPKGSTIILDQGDRFVRQK